jgi:hypothetical protein
VYIERKCMPDPVMAKKKKTPEKKETNPKDAIGVKKVPMSCVSSQALVLIANAYVEEGIAAIDTLADISLIEEFSITISHLMAFWEGYDDEWKCPHLARAMARTMRIRAAELDGTLDDDREHRLNADGVQIVELNKAAAVVLDRLPPAVPPFLHKNTGSTGFQVLADLKQYTPFHVLPWRVVLEMALGMMEGGIKYGRHNYRACGVRCSVYYDATMRHLIDYYAGKPIDPDSKLSHLSKALSSAQVLLDGMVNGNWVDDRPLRIGEAYDPSAHGLS